MDSTRAQPAIKKGTAIELEIEVVTPHGEPVPDAAVRLTDGGAELTAVESQRGVYLVTLRDTGDYLLDVERSGKPGGFDHRPFHASLCLEERNGKAALVAPPLQRGASSIARIAFENGAYHVRIILDYLWFTPIGFPPTLGNRVELLVDGEMSWRAIAQSIADARETIHVTTWIYQPTTELLRPNPLTDPDARAPFAIQNVLEERAEAGVNVRILLWDAPVLQLPAALRRAGEAADDRFEVMQEENPAREYLLGKKWKLTNEVLGRLPIGSFHQKTVAVDGRVAYCGGMNLKENDWDTRAHRVFEPRRCAFSRSAEIRAQVAAGARRPDYPPRHDFMVRVEGPSVAHVEQSFLERWNRLIDQGAQYSAQASRVPPPAAQPPAGPSQAQVVRTMPSPHPERGILDVYLRAIAAARQLIYIEDQYFRSVHVSNAIAEAVRATPGLAVVVVASEAQANNLFAAGWSRVTFDRIQAALPDFELYSLRVAGEDDLGRRVLVELDNHAKLLVVDDRFALVGSCNANERGFELDGEMDVAVADADLARSIRLDLWREHLDDDPRLSGDIDADLAVWRELAEQNRGYDPRAAISPPAGRVFPFVPRGRRWTLFGDGVF